MSAARDPSGLAHFKVPGYTGHVHGGHKVFGRTPVLAQLEAAQTDKAKSPLAAHAAPPVADGKSDVCAKAAAQLGGAHGPPNLWPCLQTTGAQEPAKPLASNLRLGDGRIDIFVTSYSAQFDAPFEASKKLRSPLRNTALQHAADVRSLYRSAYGRVGEKRLRDVLSHMKERLAGKLGNRNDNAFKLRKLFAMYDTDRSGLVDIEDFRVTTEAFGIQLDDDSLFALFHKFDPEGTGRLAYHVVMRELLDPADYLLFAGGADPLHAQGQAQQ